MNESNDALPQAAPGQCAAEAPAPATLSVPTQPSYLALIGTVVRWFADQAGLNDEQCYELEVAVDEVCTNVIRYAFPEKARGEMIIVCSPLNGGLGVSVFDRGKPFDLEEGIKIAEEKRSRDRASGGMGLMLIRKLTDEVHYRWDEEKGNQFTLIKYG